MAVLEMENVLDSRTRMGMACCFGVGDTRRARPNNESGDGPASPERVTMGG